METFMKLILVISLCGCLAGTWALLTVSVLYLIERVNELIVKLIVKPVKNRISKR